MCLCTFFLINAETDENNRGDRVRLITSSSLASGLLVYIVVLYICIFVRHRIKRTDRGFIPELLHYHNYDEIGPFSNEATNTRRIATNQIEHFSETTFVSGQQNESITTNINGPVSINGSTSSRDSLQESQLDAAQRSFNAETAIDTSSPLPFEEIRHSNGSYNEDSSGSTDESLQSFQRRSPQHEHSSNSKNTSTCSSTIDQSEMETSLGLNIGDGYENPYQIVIHENQGTHQYSSMMDQSAGVDSAMPTSGTDENTSNVTDYVNLRL